MNKSHPVSFSFRTWSSTVWCASTSRTAWRGTLLPSASVCRARPPHRTSSKRWLRSSDLTWGCSPRLDTPCMRSTSAGVSRHSALRSKFLWMCLYLCVQHLLNEWWIMLLMEDELINYTESTVSGPHCILHILNKRWMAGCSCCRIAINCQPCQCGSSL